MSVPQQGKVLWRLSSETAECTLEGLRVVSELGPGQAYQKSSPRLDLIGASGWGKVLRRFWKDVVRV